MKQSHFARFGLALAAAAALSCAAFSASATMHARVEFVQLSRLGSPGGQANLQPVTILGAAQVQTVGSTAVTTSAAPTFTDGNGASVYGHARITALDGAVVVRKGGVADVTHGWRVAQGAQVFIPVTAGDTLSLVEDTTVAAISPAGDATAALQGTGNASLASIDSKASNLATSANQVTELSRLATIVTNTTTPPLPTGAATSANQATANTSLATLVTNSLTNPTGAATAALQTTGNTSLATIATNTATPPLPTGAATSANQATANTSLATIATNSGTEATAALQTAGNTSLATIATNSLTNPTGAATSALQTTANTSLATIATNTGALPSGAATSALQTTGNTSLATLATASASQATAANQTTGNTSLATIATQTTTSATQNTTQNTNLVALLTNAQGRFNSSQQQFTRPADVVAYSVGDIISTAIDTTATPLVITGATISAGTGTGVIRNITVRLPTGGAGPYTVRVHLFSGGAPSLNAGGDNLASTFTATNGYLGFVDVVCSGAGFINLLTGTVSGLAIPYSTTSDSIWVYVEAQTAFTPANAGVVRVRIGFERSS